MNIVLIGMMGAGKTTLGKKIASLKNMDFIDVDEYIVDKSEMSINDMFKFGEDFFRDKETEAIKELSCKDNTVISCGGGVVKRKINSEILKQYGKIIYIDRPVECILKDINAEERPLLKDGSDKLYQLYNERKELYEKCCDYRVINDEDEESCIIKILDIMKIENEG